MLTQILLLKREIMRVDEEWRVVRRRGRIGRPNFFSEGNPVRQIKDPNHRLNLTNPRNQMITGSTAVKWNFAEPKSVSGSEVKTV